MGLLYFFTLLTGITARNRKKLHDKMSDHQKSQAHKNCAKELDIRSAKLIEESNKKAGNIWRERNSARIQNTARVFRTVYVVAWKHLSFRVHSQPCRAATAKWFRPGKYALLSSKLQ